MFFSIKFTANYLQHINLNTRSSFFTRSQGAKTYPKQSKIIKMTLVVSKMAGWIYFPVIFVYPFQAKVQFLQPLKTSENLAFSEGIEMNIDLKWVKQVYRKKLPPEVFCKKILLKTSQYSPVLESLLIKLQALRRFWS